MSTLWRRSQSAWLTVSLSTGTVSKFRVCIRPLRPPCLGTAARDPTNFRRWVVCLGGESPPRGPKPSLNKVLACVKMGRPVLLRGRFEEGPAGTLFVVFHIRRCGASAFARSPGQRCSDFFGVHVRVRAYACWLKKLVCATSHLTSSPNFTRRRLKDTGYTRYDVSGISGATCSALGARSHTSRRIGECSGATVSHEDPQHTPPISFAYYYSAQLFWKTCIRI